MRERWYPIYTFTIWWEITNPMTKYDNETRHTVEQSTIAKQFHVPPTPEELEAYVRKFWIEMLMAERGSLPTLADRGAVLVGYAVEVREIEAWYGGWFQHVSLNTHLSDKELFESFRQFVDRKREADFNLRVLRGPRQEGVEYYCLMGAEDRWRWKGPCRCEHCQAQGVVRIDH